MLPPDLRTAEAEALASLRSALAGDSRGRWTMELRFEGLRLLPVVLRLAGALESGGLSLRLLFPDAGAAALARRDGPELAERIATFNDHLRMRGESPAASPANDDDGTSSGGPGDSAPEVLILVGASQADYGSVESVCQAHAGRVVLVNPGLEAGAVGIGSVGRERRRGFLAQWEAAYALIPLAGSALRRAHPLDWELYRLDPDGYRLAASFDHRPDGEERDGALESAGGGGIGMTLRSVDRLLDGLQR
jgi:hypothetical protein